MKLVAERWRRGQGGGGGGGEMEEGAGRCGRGQESGREVVDGAGRSKRLQGGGEGGREIEEGAGRRLAQLLANPH